jgi:hypothetical protein
MGCATLPSLPEIEECREDELVTSLKHRLVLSN